MKKTDQQIIEEGVRAIQEKLGLVDSLRFIRLVAKRDGNYSEERDLFLESKRTQQINE
jgi:hypothetical protein